MPEKIPVSAIKKFAKDNGLTAVVCLGWDGERSHILTYGDSIVECDKAAIVGDNLKDYLGWPETLHSKPSRVKALQKENNELKEEVENLKSVETLYEMEQRLGKKLLQEW